MTRSTIILLLLSAPLAFGAVVVNTNISLTPAAGHTPPYDYELTIQQFEVAGDPTSIFLNKEGENLVFGDRNLDEGSDWYFASFNDVLNADTIAQGLFPAFDVMGQSYPVGYTDFYLGVATSPGFSGSTERTIFGWALLRNSPDQLELLGSGVSYDDPGVIVGTTMVPEASSLGFAAIATLSLLRIRRREN